MAAKLPVGMPYYEVEFGAAVLVEGVNTLVFAIEMLKYGERLCNAVLAHSRKIRYTDNPDKIANLDSSSASVGGCVWFHQIERQRLNEAEPPSNFISNESSCLAIELIMLMPRHTC